MDEVNTMKTDTSDAITKLTKVKNSAKAKITEFKAVSGPNDGENFIQAMIDDFDGIISSYDVLIKMMYA